VKIGVAYYPEQWPEERWPVDARLMARLNIDVVRVGEFAWSRLEPRRERIETDWFQRAVGVLADHGLKVIIGTPTAAPPAWLFSRHPGMTPVGPDGRRWHSGSRRHVCLSNPAYLKYARRIVTELARCFNGSSQVYAWQVDSELGGGPGGVCYCAECEQAFRRWLKRRYGTIERLNRQWGTAFWSQRFSDWHEVPAPRRTPGGPHPSLVLDYMRFVSAQHRAFIQEQRQLIKQYAGESAVVTASLPGALEAPHLNAFALAMAQDVVSVNNFPGDAARVDLTALQLDLARCAKGRPFWVLQQQAGAIAMPGASAQPRPGQLRLWSYQAAARGAELIAYFRWRTGPAGQQMHWYGLLEADGTPERRFEELRRTIQELKERAALWEGRLPRSEVAMVLHYDSAWALAATPLGAELDYFAHVRALYGVLRRAGVQVDFLPPSGDLSGYRLLIVPMPFVCDVQLARQLELYVHEGGQALVTAPAGYKTPVNTAAGGGPPGEYGGLLGVKVIEHDVLPEGAENFVEIEGTSGRFPTGRFCSLVQLRGARTLGTYGAQFYAGTPALTVRAEGSGEVVFVGPVLDAQGYAAVIGLMLERAKVTRSEWACPLVEVVPLGGGEGKGPLTFVLNHGQEPVSLPLAGGEGLKELLSGQECHGSLTVPGYGVALLNL